MLVQLTRGDVVESSHRVDAAVVDHGRALTEWGAVDRPVIARSALKFIQALPLLRTGAADRYGVSAEELTLACSSHSGEPAHVDAVRRWLARLGLDQSALECGPDVPISAEAQAENHRLGLEPDPIFNCCSGKHAGFLSVARHLGLEPAGYIEPDHPVQRLVTEAVAEFTGRRLEDQTPGRDGCGIPTFGIPLRSLAEAMGRLVTPSELSGDTAAGATRLVDAAIGREFWLAGTGRHEVTVGRRASEPVLLKGGAEGVFMAGLPTRGVGIALKVADGAGRAAEAAISAILAHLGVVPTPEGGQPITNKAGAEVGRMTVDLGHEHREPVDNRLAGDGAATGPG